ncbi:hypothetical protein DPEC_G00320980 [Dallia pectoralis]|uniref:Uncharacterized protein n=1 Tax=Dallia pectoralis TaxID=75939 RepID=A0ACC2FA31_DALPE|nr:hypothetical protein DPEC_G00320980 [Dallia pectoralis]
MLFTSSGWRQRNRAQQQQSHNTVARDTEEVPSVRCLFRSGSHRRGFPGGTSGERTHLRTRGAAPAAVSEQDFVAAPRTGQTGTVAARASCCPTAILKLQPPGAESLESSRCPSSQRHGRNRSLMGRGQRRALAQKDGTKS